ncbi:MAG TPA: ATP-binding protein [Solirubrobacteraceae bacterium]|nr:ATP-binding protein [Solirubrobacteraceae bacterium]
MAGSTGLDAAWVLPARAPAITQLRHRAVEFAAAAGASRDVVERIAFSVSETVTNVVLHAYGDDGGQVGVNCRLDGGRFLVQVIDDGMGIAPRRDSPGIGQGLTIVGALAQTLEITFGRGGRGTVVTMGFGPAATSDAPPGLEMLCALALEEIADASCVDLVQDGVLRRLAAEVAGEPAMTAWLRAAMPPAKPGTATWTALREGGARLVVHDPTIPRSPGGPGERLDLTWWVAVALPAYGGSPAALWGFGGRPEGHPVPSEEVLRLLTGAAGGNLAQPAGRAILRAQLAMARG